MSHKATLTSFTQDELFRLMHHMQAHDPQLHAMALLSLWHGMRRGEVLELTPANFRNGRITFERLKNSNSSCHKLTKHHVPEFDEVTAVQRYLDYPQVRDDGRVMMFDSNERQVNRLMQRYCDAVGISRHKAHWSSFKHTCCKLLLPVLGVAELQVHVGHVEAKNTLRYGAASEEETQSKLEAAIAESRAQLAAMRADAGGD
jgi:integrase